MDVKIEVKRIEIPLDPPINVFSVEITKGGGTWMETLPSEESLRWFLRGIQAGAQAAGEFVFLPEIPTRASSLEEVS